MALILPSQSSDRQTAIVYVFVGKPPAPLDAMIPDKPGETWSLFDLLKFYLFFAVPRIPRIISNRPSVVAARLERVGLSDRLSAAWDLSAHNCDANAVPSSHQREEGIHEDWRRWVSSSIYPISSRLSSECTVSYCLGGMMAIRFGSTDLLQSAVIAHPGPFTISEIRAVKIPTSWIVPESKPFSCVQIGSFTAFLPLRGCFHRFKSQTRGGGGVCLKERQARICRVRIRGLSRYASEISSVRIGN